MVIFRCSEPRSILIPQPHMQLFIFLHVVRMKFAANLISKAGKVKLSYKLAAWVDVSLMPDLVFRSFSGFRTRVVGSSPHCSFSYVILSCMYSSQMNIVLLSWFPLCISHSHELHQKLQKELLLKLSVQLFHSRESFKNSSLWWL